MQARHRDTPYAIAARHFPTGQLDTARDEILDLNAGRVLPDGTTYRGGGFPAGWDVIVPAGATAVTTKVDTPPPVDEPTATSGHLVADSESYWSISENQLRVELGREPTPQEIFDRTQTAIAYNAPRLGYDNPKMIHPGDVISVDATTLSTSTSGASGAAGAPVIPAEPATAVQAVTGGHVVADGESYWSISETQLRVELGREPSPREALDRADVAIAFNAPRLARDDPIMLHPGDVVFVDDASLSLVAPPAAALPAPADPVVPAVTEPPAGEVPAPAPAPPVTPAWTPPTTPIVTDAGDLPVPPYSTPVTTPAPSVPVTSPIPTLPVPAVASTAPPVTPAPRVSPEVTSVDHEDMLSSRWLFGGIAVTSLGLVGAWTTVKQKRRRRRRWLGLPATADVNTAPTEREREAQLDVAMLRQFVDPARVASNEACAVVLGAHPEIRFRVPTPPAPTGWQLADDRWRRDDTEPWTAAPVLSPALVTIGHGTDETISDVVLDLLSAGTVSVTGDRVAVERLMCSMLWELATAPLGDNIELHVVGLTCAAAHHAINAGRLVSLDEAIAVAQTPFAGTGQVFLVDPFADDTATGSLRELVEACAPGSGRAVVVAGPCEHPVEEISVPSERRAMWDDLTLVPPQLPESVDVELDRMLDALEVGRRGSAVSLAVTPDPAVEALGLRSTLTAVGGGAGDTFTSDVDDTDVDDTDGDDGDGGGGAEPVAVGDPGDEGPVIGGDLVDVPNVVLSVCGREVTVRGHSVPKASAVLFVLAAAGREMHSNEITELTGYATKTLSTVFPGSHDLVEREAGTLRLADHVWTDHAWATKCVAQLAEAMRVDAGSADTARWMMAAMDGLQALEQGPFAVLPASRERAGSSPWGWVDDFPADVPARRAAETEIAEAALALSELWLAAPGTHRVVRAEQMVSELGRLAATVPYATVVRQLRPSMWESGAECLLSAAARVASDDETLLGRVHQTARALAAREQLEASNALADELGL